MIKIGITGNIGSGKSVVCELLKIHGIPVYNADKEAKRLNDFSPTIREKLIRHFGKEIYVGNKLDKNKFAQLIFNDPEKLSLANSIIHPEVAKDFAAWVASKNNYPIVALEAAVLFEGNFHHYVDKTITVYAPLELRIARASQRDNVPIEKIKEREKNQIPDEEKLKMADFVIYNDEKHALIPQVSNLLKQLGPIKE
jgi:dephospho-CoA kinase